jgi:hypothetical protein
VWEWFYGYQANLQLPVEDEDGDSDTNLTESIFGTDPFLPASRQPQITLAAPNPDLGFSFPSVKGGRYQLQGTSDLGATPFADLGSPLNGTGSTMAGTISGPFGSRYFVRLQGVTPRPDEDGDGLDAYEEAIFGSIDTAANSDTDDLTDLEEFRLNQLGIRLDPTKEFTVAGVRDGDGDFDGDGAKDKDELRGGSSPTSSTSYPPGNPDLDLDRDQLPDLWETQFFGNTTAQDATGNPDSDRLNNRAEFLLDTNPTMPMTRAHPDGLEDQDADNVIDIWELEDGTNPKSSASFDVQKNFITLRGRLEHLSSFGPGGTLFQYEGTKMRATAIEVEGAQIVSSTGATGIVNEVSGFTNTAANTFIAERTFLRFRKGVNYRVEIIAGQTNLPFVSGKFFWSTSATNNDEPDNKFFHYQVDNRQWYLANANGVPEPADPNLSPNPDPQNTHFTQKGPNFGDPNAVLYPTGTLRLPPVLIYGDTDRDGAITPRDIENRGTWSNQSGAIFSVNCDADEGRPAVNGFKVTDSLDIADDGTTENEDWTIRHADDLPDLAPLRIPKIPALSSDVKVFLKAEPSTLSGARPVQQVMHLYPKIAVGQQAIWGAANSAAPGGIEVGAEVEITKWVNPQDPAYSTHGATVVDANGDYTFGLEGLFFRNFGAVNKFDGRVVLRIELRKTVNATTTVIGFDKVELRVAPLILLSHKESVEKIYVAGNPNPLLAIPSPEIVSTSEILIPGIFPPLDPFIQDMVEIGYTQRPGGPQTHVIFRCPKGSEGRHYGWPKNRIGRDIGVFQLKKDTFRGAGDYGGNIETIPPTDKLPLGRVIIGSTSSDELNTFFNSQGFGNFGIQEPQLIVTNWLYVGHVDELFNYLPTPGQVVVASPKRALDILQQEFNSGTEEERNKMVFFATKTATGDLPSDILTQTVSQDTSMGGGEGSKIWTGVNYAGNPAQYSQYKFLRIFAGVGAGQIARIKQDGTGYGNGYLLVDLVWNTGSHTNAGIGVSASNFFPTKPKQNDRFVLVENSKRYNIGNSIDNTEALPALTTAVEVLADTLFKYRNQQWEANISSAKVQLQTLAKQQLNFIPVPSLFSPFGTKNPPSAASFTPNLNNFQPVNGSVYFPKPFAPIKAGKDIFEADVEQRIGGAVFIDDWSVYHIREGEVHCGSATKRIFPTTAWWKTLKP